MKLFSRAEYRRNIPSGGIAERDLKAMDGQMVVDGAVIYIDENGRKHERPVKDEWCEQIGPLSESAIRVMFRWLKEARRENAALLKQNLQLRDACLQLVENSVNPKIIA